MKLTKDFQLSGLDQNDASLYIGPHFIGSVGACKAYLPLHSMVAYASELKRFGLTAISPDESVKLPVDWSEFREEYFAKDRLIEQMQRAVAPGKWAVYAYRSEPNGCFTVDVGVVLPLVARGCSFNIYCDDLLPIEWVYYYDRHFTRTHWFLPPGCVIGLRLKFYMPERPPYLTFRFQFDDFCLAPLGECYRDLVNFTSLSMLSKLPNVERIHRVSSINANQSSFLNGGRSAFNALRSLAVRNGVSFDERRLAVLDWGVGCGRVARHFVEEVDCDLHGLDIDRDNIDWCNTNLDGKYTVVDLNPPTSIRDSSCDLIYSCSVLSHLTERDADAWLAELSRVLSPQGLALLSFNGLSNAAAYLSRRPEEFRRVLRSQLFDSDINHELDGFVPDANYYRATFASDAWWSDMFERHFKLLSIELSVVSGYQHVAVLKKKA